MPHVTFTTFVDFVSATGTTRITRVRDAKQYYAMGYSPMRDFYKPFRDRLESCCTDGWDANAFQRSLHDVTDPKKLESYEQCRAGFSKWVGRKTITAMPTVRSVWTSGDLHVGVNPELHLMVNGVQHVIKLYLKAPPLSQTKATVPLRLLEQHPPSGAILGMLDVRRSKLFTPTRSIDGLDELLAAEAAAFSSLWTAL
jgi:hypothetical protein